MNKEIERCINVVESRENEKAKEEGRNTLIYASNGEKYYK